MSSHPVGRPLIVSVGRYIPKKGFCTLVEACSRLELRDFECQIVGNGPLEVSLKEQAALLGIQDRCRSRVQSPRARSSDCSNARECLFWPVHGPRMEPWIIFRR